MLSKYFPRNYAELRPEKIALPKHCELEICVRISVNQLWSFFQKKYPETLQLGVLAIRSEEDRQK